MSFKSIFFIITVLISSILCIYYVRKESTHTIKTRIENGLFDKYTFANLKHTNFKQNQILVEKQSHNELHLNVINKKKVSNLITMPNKPGTYPVVILLRGYVDKEIYRTGVGTSRIGEFFAENGFVTIAPDFLGYGKSSPASKDSLEERFQTYTTVLELLESLPKLNEALVAAGIEDISIDDSKVAIWGHSNGGHIALSVLAITGRKYPTVLWAPVSKPFPYSILYFTDEYPDNGKYLRRVIADFEEHHDIEKFNPVNYYKWIRAPIQIHQGTLDDAVPLKWSDQLNSNLTNLNIETEYYTYEGDDHNLMPNGWSQAAVRGLNFIKHKQIK
jgi:dipeptidyl aminopeptidase/acylaminoacyl peptidase